MFIVLITILLNFLLQLVAAVAGDARPVQLRTQNVVYGRIRIVPVRTFRFLPFPQIFTFQGLILSFDVNQLVFKLLSVDVSFREFGFEFYILVFDLREKLCLHFRLFFDFSDGFCQFGDFLQRLLISYLETVSIQIRG